MRRTKIIGEIEFGLRGELNLLERAK